MNLKAVKDRLRPFYSVFRPIYVPVVRLVTQFHDNAPVNRSVEANRVHGAKASTTLFPNIPPISSEAIPTNLPPFDTVLMRGRPRARLSKFHPRYPFALDRGPRARELISSDPNNPFGHEPELAHLLDLLVPDDGVFLDVGANYGYFSIYLAARPNFHGEIHAFEPVATTFAGLLGLVDSLRCDKIVTSHHVAASDELGTVKMAVAGIDPGLASIKEGNLEEGEVVQKITLDSLNFKRVDFMKIDVEGHEAQALRGARTTIRDQNPFIFFESWISAKEPERVLEPLKLLLDCEYQLYVPAWAQSTGIFHVGIGANHEMDAFALVPFALRDRFVFAGGPSVPINLFACPMSRVDELGEIYPSIV